MEFVVFRNQNDVELEYGRFYIAIWIESESFGWLSSQGVARAH